MSNELKPCPFCGSSDIKIYVTQGRRFVRTGHARCENCQMKIDAPIERLSYNRFLDINTYEDECRHYNELAKYAIIEKWNTRAERTCRIEERLGDWYCSKCNELVGTVDTASELCIDGNAIELWDFCPRCGAKVVQE